MHAKIVNFALFILSIASIALCVYIGLTAVGWSFGFALFTVTLELFAVGTLFYSIIKMIR